MTERKELNVVGKLSLLYDEKPMIRALLQLVPSWGVANSLLQQRVDEIRSDRLKTFFDELAIGKIELSEELIKSEDFLHCYFSTLRASLNTRQREKIRMFAKLLNSSLTQPNPASADEFEELLAVLDMVTLREFEVLNDLRKNELHHPPKAEENEVQNARHYWDNFRKESIQKLFIPENVFTAFMAKLERTGLYLRITITVTDYEGDIGRTTPLFARLLEFIKNRVQPDG